MPNISCFGKISTSGDVDWFDYYASSGRTLKFYMVPPSNKNYLMELYGPSAGNSAQHFLSASPAGIEQGEVITYTTTASGYFAIRVSAPDGTFSASDIYLVKLELP
jgi:hypothetical protein